MVQNSSIYLPAQFAISGKVLNNIIRQLRRPEVSENAEVGPYSGKISGQLVTRYDGTRILVVSRKVTPPTDVDEVLRISGGTVPTGVVDVRGGRGGVQWLKPNYIVISHDNALELRHHCEQVRTSWRGQFSFRSEQREADEVVKPGLRLPQIGALHSALAHWTVSYAPATIVMPTGTGKTETMLALLVSERLERLLVVVPTVPLREQLAAKFLSLGVLKPFGVVGPEALYPIVGILEHRPRTPEEADAYFQCCNVVVTTMSVASRCTDEVQRAMAGWCSHLFIDEAHHISAPTWEKFRRFFLHRTILQFTATPFRSDRKHVDGKVIFDYPLRKAQEEGYFKFINFRPVWGFNPERADEMLAQAAVRQLTQDLASGFNHLVMARASDIDRAKKIHQIYQRYGAPYAPVLIHSERSVVERRQALQGIQNSTSRIIVCVNMLGEGFDLPELKIAALHDVHKSLAITLQFTGRFTRTTAQIGDATMIANIADAEVEGALQELYAEDTDWNVILRRLSEGATARQARRSEFLDGFTEVPAELPLQNVFPKMSTVVYRTKCPYWKTDGVRKVVNEARLYTEPTVNPEQHLLLFVTRELEMVDWGDIKGLQNTIWDLYLLHWDRERRLLFINSSNNDSLHEELAKAIAGDDVERIRGEEVFRSLHGLNQLILMNLGLNHSLSRAVRFTMYVGPDIRQGLAEAHLENKIKSNLFARGYEQGDKASIGCSYKGRIWSYKIADGIAEWVEWCRHIGAKLLDETISVQDILEHVIIPESVNERPPLVPLTIEWSEAFLQRSEDAIHLDVAGEQVAFFDAGLELVEHERHGPIRFRIFTETLSVEYEVRFKPNSVEYIPLGQDDVNIIIARKSRRLSDWFQMEPPVIRFEDGGFLIYNSLYTPRRDRHPYDRERIAAWDWAGIDLGKESQKRVKRSDSIQYRVIQELLHPSHDPHYDIVFDDDDTYEAADIVALKVAGEHLLVHLFHCKFSKEDTPGSRVEDLYAVCGQAQRSIYWKGDVGGLLDHLRYRESARVSKYGASRFERGDLSRLAEMARQVPYLTPAFKIFIVQPGLSRSQATTNQLELLAVTELYLQETYAIELGVIASQ